MQLNVLRGVILEDALPSSSKLTSSSRGLPAKDIIEYVAPEIQISSLKQALNDEKTKDILLALDEQGVRSFKLSINFSCYILWYCIMINVVTVHVNVNTY